MPMLAPRNTSLPFTENGARQGRQNALRHAHGVLRPVYVAEDQHETVAAAARKSLGFAQAAG